MSFVTASQRHTATSFTAIGTGSTTTTVAQGYVLGLSAGSTTFSITSSGSGKNPFGVAVFGEAGVIPPPVIPTLNQSDAANRSSFAPFGASVPQWSNGNFPTAGLNYIVGVDTGTVNTILLRTPTDSTDRTFAGDSLKINTTGTLFIKGNTGVTNTINNLILNGGTVANGGDAASSPSTVTTVAGAISLTGTGGRFEAKGGTRQLNITAPISGSAGVVIVENSTIGAGGYVKFSGTNTYTGATTISGHAQRGSEREFGRCGLRPGLRRRRAANHRHRSHRRNHHRPHRFIQCHKDGRLGHRRWD